MTAISAGQSDAGHFRMIVVIFLLAAFVLTAMLPITMAIAIVFLFAGPHNYFETRYFLTRLPARAGRLSVFFAFSAVGIILLSISLPVISYLPQWLQLNRDDTLKIVSIWNAAVIIWCGVLITMRSRQPPRRNWDLTWPICLAIFSLSLLQPMLFPLVLVFAP